MNVTLRRIKLMVEDATNVNRDSGAFLSASHVSFQFQYLDLGNIG